MSLAAPHSQQDGPYRYVWFDGATTTNNLIPVDSIVTVIGTDGNGCIDTLEVGPFSAGPSIDIAQTGGLTCIGDSTAGLRVFSQFQNIDTLDIIWSTGDTSLEISNLSAGTYSVTVIEDAECAVVDTFEIRNPDFGVQVINPFNFIAQSSCLEPDSGILINFTSNYRGPLDFIWSGAIDAVTPGPFININSSGTYRFDLMDRITGCVVYQDSVVVDFPGQLSIDSVITDVSCNGDLDGSISVNLFQESLSSFYNFMLSDTSGNVLDQTTGETFQTSNLAPGDYNLNFVQVDDSTCTDDIVITVSEPEVLSMSVDSFNTRNPRCSGDTNGQITLNWEGGNQNTTPQISWSTTDNDGLFADNLGPGIYTIELIDGRGCQDQVSVELLDPTPLQYSIPIPEDPACNGFQTFITVDTAFGGTGPNYSFTINNQTNQLIGTEVPVFAGSYLITVFDALGCADTQSVSIMEPEAIQILLPPVDTISLGDSSLLIPTASGPSPIDDYSWTTQSQPICMDCPILSVSPIDDQAFTVTVTDIQGCTAEQEILILVDKAKRLYIPNAFSPNDDGLNDFFELFPSAGVASIDALQIYDRWGSLVYQQEDVPVNTLGVKTWNGLFATSGDPSSVGKPADPGVYVYTVQVTFKDDKVLMYRGDVTLLR